MNDKKILIVDDDPDICRLLSHFLRQEGYQVQHAGDGREMWKLRQTFSPHLLILDLNLPDENGFTLAQRLREVSDVPIIMLSGQAQTRDKVTGLELGADDYLAKPFDRRELLARIHNLLRRSVLSGRQRQASRHGAASFSGWTLDLGARELRSPDEQAIYLTRHEYELLTTFVKRSNRALTRAQITDYISGREWSPSDRSIDMLVGKLRKKLGDNPRRPALIKSIRGVGYKFASSVQFG